MASLVNKNLNRISQLLSDYKFTIVNGINKEYKCGICKNIINNAHQTICGCNFCLECINQFIENGGIKCPTCEYENLSNIAPNHRLNNQRSAIIVNCPIENCSYDCKLIDMEEHLKSCSMKSAKCPFNDIGCESEEIGNDKLKEHFMLNIESHNKMLIELIGQLSNELREFKENDKINRLEIEILKEANTRKDEDMESMRNELNSIKQANQQMKISMENNNNTFWKILNEIDIRMNEKFRNDSNKSIISETEYTKMNLSELSEQIKILDRNCQDLNEKLKEIQQIKNENEKKIKKINQIDKFLNMRNDGHLWWQIGKINEIKWMKSDYFYDSQNPYKMRLGMKLADGKLTIWLWIQAGAFDTDLKWPLKANIKIHIYPLNDNATYKSMEKLCMISKPENNSFKWSDKISFFYSDLEQMNLINTNCMLVSSVKFE